MASDCFYCCRKCKTYVPISEISNSRDNMSSSSFLSLCRAVNWINLLVYAILYLRWLVALQKQRKRFRNTFKNVDTDELRTERFPFYSKPCWLFNLAWRHFDLTVMLCLLGPWCKGCHEDAVRSWEGWLNAPLDMCWVTWERAEYILATTDTVDNFVNGHMLAWGMFLQMISVLLSWTVVALALTYMYHKRGLVGFPLFSVVTEDTLVYCEVIHGKKRNNSQC